jgi:DNA polymerase III subunit chi
MTRVEFFFNVADKPQKIVELASSAVRKGRRLFVYTDVPSTTQQLQDYLWGHAATSFLPNCTTQEAWLAQTPIVVDHQATQLPHDDLLINLQATHPAFFSRFRRLIEIVGTDETDKVAARVRYKFYRDRGYEIRTFDAQGQAL